MPLSLSTAQKTMAYAKKKPAAKKPAAKKPAAKKTAAKKPAAKKPAAGAKKPAAGAKKSGLRPFAESNAGKGKGPKKMPPAMLKRMEEMKKKKDAARKAKGRK